MTDCLRPLLRTPAGERILAMRQALKDRRDPVCADEVLGFLLAAVRALDPEKILEIGTAEGLSGAAMLAEAPRARLTTVEIDEGRCRQARENFASLGFSGRARCILGDAADVLPALDGPFDLVFLDGPKVQHVRYLPAIARLLRGGGVLIADDVLLYGWVDGRVPVPPKRRALVGHIREYLAAVTAEESGFLTSVLPIGEGVAVSVKERQDTEWEREKGRNCSRPREISKN